MKKLISIVALSLFALSFSLTHAATSDLRLTTSPLPINLKTAPGTVISTPLKIKNDGTQTENIKITLMKFKADGTTGAPMLEDKTLTDEYFSWVKFSDPTFSLPANEWKTVTATFTVPTEASFGYYYAIVFGRADEQVTPEDRQTVVTGGTAVLVLLEAQVADAKREITVTDFKIDKGMFEFLPINFQVNLRNTGNVHIAPRGNIFISQGNDKDVAILEVNQNKGSILPDSPRSFQESWIDGFPYYQNKTQDGKVVMDATGNPEQELKWDFSQVSKLRWGKYTAKLLLIYDDGKRDVPIEAEVSFWVVPWRIVI
ncbi:MAG: hypothetical protein Q7T51_01735, partial [Candidatus Moranbacteria bacterium]|nr:hypothetical protein [Candidatus Moranbacteria bacterium]